MKRTITIFSAGILMALVGCQSVPPVTMIDQGDAWVIDNAKVQLELNKENGRITSLKYGERELLAQKGIYMQFYAKGDAAENAAPSAIKVFHETADMIDVARCTSRKGFDVEMHYVVRAGESGFYNYIVVRNDPEKVPGERSLEQVNLLVRANPELFNYGSIGSEKSDYLPSPQQMKQGELIMDATYLLEDGTVDAKYDWCLEETGERVFGLMGDELGMFIVKDSGEALNSGPVARELTLHATTATPVLMRHFTGAHYGRGSIVLNEEDGQWAKLAGPWMIYINEGDSHEEMWADAKKQSEKAQKAWPYKWLDSPLYPLERGKVKGRLTLADGSSAAGSLIFIGPTPTKRVPDWKQSGKGFFFWTKADADGSFEIDKVRAGNYSIWALNDHTFGEFRQDGVGVTVGKTTKVGTLDWTPEQNGTVLWQIGSPDRTSAEFRNGQDSRNWGLWLKYAKEFPNDVDFTVGESDERTDWNYVQPAVQNSDGTWCRPMWTIRFNLDEALEGEATLRIGVAGVCAHAGEATGVTPREAGFDVMINGSPKGAFRFPHDKGASRSSVRGNYNEVVLPFDAAELKVGENVITLSLESMPPEGIVKNFPYCSVMYDAIRLELSDPPE